jgi:hypothetical protein
MVPGGLFVVLRRFGVVFRCPFWHEYLLQTLASYPWGIDIASWRRKLTNCGHVIASLAASSAI